jgi:hypothetical protein
MAGAARQKSRESVSPKPVHEIKYLRHEDQPAVNNAG